MAEKETKGVPPVTPKSKGVEHLTTGSRSQTVGGDIIDRYRQQYSKNPPPREDPFYEG
ncbi:hypothetical protein EVB41_015 [Rhizobium phage RHph_TM3_14A]|nr:hypothetical protein EVB29_015 [Rhizobium phage RHph_TM27A]QIG66935.1 hypothetical protein EVB30_015 [Rhizobium phage RHph_TM27B]QIG67025.1 hypothetical protein EVB31_015 [Rhizobium phage RHph_TM29]QIG67480.1 hypothetical protein EVB41_015 [Rhizobium phage RHph_TM3_14A]